MNFEKLIFLLQGNEKFRKETQVCLERNKQEYQKLYNLRRDVHFMQVIMTL